MENKSPNAALCVFNVAYFAPFLYSWFKKFRISPSPELNIVSHIPSQNFHHLEIVVLNCFIVFSLKDAVTIGTASSGIFFLKNPWRRASLQPGKVFSIVGVLL